MRARADVDLAAFTAHHRARARHAGGPDLDLEAVRDFQLVDRDLVERRLCHLAGHRGEGGRRHLAAAALLPGRRGCCSRCRRRSRCCLGREQHGRQRHQREHSGHSRSSFEHVVSLNSCNGKVKGCGVRRPSSRPRTHESTIRQPSNIDPRATMAQPDPAKLRRSTNRCRVRVGLRTDSLRGGHRLPACQRPPTSKTAMRQTRPTQAPMAGTPHQPVRSAGRCSARHHGSGRSACAGCARASATDTCRSRLALPAANRVLRAGGGREHGRSQPGKGGGSRDGENPEWGSGTSARRVRCLGLSPNLRLVLMGAPSGRRTPMRRPFGIARA